MLVSNDSEVTVRGVLYSAIALHHAASPAPLDQPGPSPLDAPARPAPSSTSKPIGSTHRGSGIDFKDLPKRYQRKPLDQQEIDIITVGNNFFIAWLLTHFKPFTK